MTQPQVESNPFALLMNPEAVFAAIEGSERLSRLQSRICRPLDKPLIGAAEAEPVPSEVDLMQADAECSELEDDRIDLDAAPFYASSFGLPSQAASL